MNQCLGKILPRKLVKDINIKRPFQIRIRNPPSNRVQNPRITCDFAPVFNVMQKVISTNIRITSNMSPVTSKKGFLAH